MLTLVVGSLAYPMDDERATRAFAEEIITKCNQNNRHFKSALLFVAADSAQAMREDARKWLAWEAIQDEAHEMQLDESPLGGLRVRVALPANRRPARPPHRPPEAPRAPARGP